VASPTYRLEAVVVPCTIIGASATATSRSGRRPARNRSSVLVRYRPSTVASAGTAEKYVTFDGR